MERIQIVISEVKTLIELEIIGPIRRELGDELGVLRLC